MNLSRYDGKETHKAVFIAETGMEFLSATPPSPKVGILVAFGVINNVNSSVTIRKVWTFILFKKTS